MPKVTPGQFKIKGLFAQNFNPNVRSEGSVLKAKRESKLVMKQGPVKVAIDEQNDEEDYSDIKPPPFRAKPKPII